MSVRFVRPVATASFALVALAGVAQADTLTTYSSQAAFLAATNGGAGLGFENYDALSGTFANSLSFTGGGSTMVADTVGSFSTTPGALWVPAGVPGNSSPSLLSNYYVNSLRLTFSPSVNAFGTGLFSWLRGSTFSIDVRDSQSVVHNYLVSVPSGGSFFGFTVTGGSVMRIIITGTGDDAEGIDNTYWGNANLSVVPLPPAALAGMGGLASVGIVGAIRRRRVAK